MIMSAHQHDITPLAIMLEMCGLHETDDIFREKGFD